MHLAAMEWIARFATEDEVKVLDVGGRNINGTPRDLFPNADYTTVDLVEHESVDIVGDILKLDAKKLGGPFDIIIYAEVAEHTEDWAAHLAHLFGLLADDGVLVITAANLERTPHSAIDGGQLRDGEFYENIDPEVLTDALYELSDYYQIDVVGADVRAMAVGIH